MEITESSFDYESPEFKLSSLLEIDLVGKKDDIEEVTDGAEAQWGGLVISGLATQNNCNVAGNYQLLSRNQL